MIAKIISKSGHELSLQEWQKYYGLTEANQLGVYFTTDEQPFKNNIEDYGHVVVNELLMRLLDRFRSTIKKPVKINAFNRNEAKQQELQERGFRTAKTSPHVVCMAADIDTISDAQTENYVAILKMVAKELSIKIRIGYKQYQADGSTFIHVDVCPEYYAPGKPFNKHPHPTAWEIELTW
jgi:uncharacterized protein YcbK (DUF882 family)